MEVDKKMILGSYSWGSKSTVNEILEHIDWGFLFDNSSHLPTVAPEVRFHCPPELDLPAIPAFSVTNALANII